MTSTRASRNKNKIPYKVCLNSISVPFDNGYKKIKTMKETMNLAHVKQHGLKNRVSNRAINKVNHNQKSRKACISISRSYKKKWKHTQLVLSVRLLELG